MYLCGASPFLVCVLQAKYLTLRLRTAQDTVKTMRKTLRNIMLLAALMASLPEAAQAQKDALEAAKTALDAGKVQQAETQIGKALSNDDTRNNPETWSVAGHIQLLKSEEQHRKAYLGKAYDTLVIYNSTLDMCRYFMRCDSLAQLPDDKGRVRNKFRKGNAQAATEARANLLNGGIYFYNKSDADRANALRALDFFGTYVDLAQSPLMSRTRMTAADSTEVNRTAYYACLAAMKTDNYRAVAEYYNKGARRDGSHGALAALYCSQAYKELGQTDSVRTVLTEAFRRYPDNETLFTALTDYYTSLRDYNSAIALTDSMLVRDGSNYTYYYIKGYLLFGLRDYDGALRQYSRAIDLNPRYAEAYSNTGLIYRIMAQDYADRATNDINNPRYAEEQNVITGYYQKARQNYEKARELKPDSKDLWLDGLYSVYYNLKMGKEFGEIDRMR